MPKKLYRRRTFYKLISRKQISRRKNMTNFLCSVLFIILSYSKAIKLDCSTYLKDENFLVKI